MSKSRRQFTPEEKYSILQEAEREGPTETARKYNLAYSVLSNWKRKYLSKGKDGLKPGYKKIDPQLRALEEENARLKKIVANQALELDRAAGAVQDRAIKKKRCPLSERKEMIAEYRGKWPVADLCQWAGVPKSSLYYKAREGVRGIRPSTHTIVGGFALVENNLVVDQIRAILTMDYCVYGYRKMTEELRDMEYEINAKKVYRLMREHHLLSGKRIQAQGKRKWVKHRRIDAKHPMEYLSLDIKYIWRGRPAVQGESRWYYQLAIMDVYSRRILCWILQGSVRQADVIALMRWLDLSFGLKGVIIRNDNGSQFIAHKVREALQLLEAEQEFTHVVTSQYKTYRKYSPAGHRLQWCP